MATDKQDKKTADNADVHATTNRDFYPEDARERNFEEARRMAVANHEADVALAKEDAKKQAELEEKEASKRSIDARPETTASTNPEQVKTNESKTSTPSDDASKESK